MKFLFTLLILCSTSLLYADDLRVFVTPFESETNDNDLIKKVSVISAKEVIDSKGFAKEAAGSSRFIYVSPTAFTNSVVRKEKIVEKNVNLEKEYDVKNLNQLQEMHKPYQDTLDGLVRALEAADVILGGKVERKGSLVKVEVMIANPKTQKDYSVMVECEESRLNSEMRKAVNGLLKKISRVEKIYADKLTDPKWSKVIYVVRTMDSSDVTVEVDYTGDRPNPQIQNVRIIPPDNLNQNDVTTLKVKSTEGKIIGIDFDYKLGKLESVRVDTSMPDPSKKGKQSETLTVKSRAGYLLEFVFVWKDGSMESAQLTPKINPFGDFEQ